MLRFVLHELAKNRRLGRWITSNPTTRRMAQRFVPGEDISHAVGPARRCNESGLSVSFNHLGENVLTEADAYRARDSYLAILDTIANEKLNANVSVKLTQLGFDLGDEFCAAQLRTVVERAASYGNFVRVDMEGSVYTDRTIRIVKQLRAETEAVGTVIQAYLFRSEHDIADLMSVGCRIRLVKGAYKESPKIAFPKKLDVDANYVKLMRILLASGVYHAFATHDPKMIDATTAFAAESGIAKDQYEFQMLYGIRTDLQARLVREGYRVRAYIPYGEDWFPYFMRRLAERPANLLFFAKNLFRGGASNG
jgi:proline dehydrogenase